MLWQRLHAERQRGRAYQPRFAHADVIKAWLGGLVAITALGLLSAWSHYPLVVAPFGASTVLLFGHPRSPLAQPRNIVLGNTIAAAVSVLCVAWLGTAPWVMGLAVGLTIALGQVLRCLHPPAGAVALLGVLLHAKPSFILMPVLSGSVVITAMAVLFSRLHEPRAPYPHHWL
ncbi:MAG: HPP family protein [Synechococcaceae bacterium WB8_1B_136]|nr:HPP family protein [Synechococcaceae bacterium WB8_1B_136]